MKLIALPLIILSLFSFSQEKSAEELYSEGLEKYSTRSAMVNYEITGDAEGSEVLVFDKNGWQSMRKQTIIFKLYGLRTIQTLHEIKDGDWVYRLNEGDSSITSKVDLKWSQLATYKSPSEASVALLLSMGGSHAYDTALLEKPCRVWTFENKSIQELWIWDGIAMRRKTKLGDQIIISTAKEIETNQHVDSTLFSIPVYLKEK